MLEQDEIEQIVMACCHLHNLSIRAGDTDDFEESDEEDDMSPPPPIPPAINEEAEGRLKHIMITKNIDNLGLTNTIA